MLERVASFVIKPSAQVIRTVTDGIAECGMTPLALTFSPIKGAEGEY